MSEESIALSRKINNQLLAHALTEPEQEVCGLIGSINNLPVRCYPIKNSALNCAGEFLLDSAEHIHALKLMRERGEELFAIYHSHPHAPAEPSAKDLILQGYDNILYLIISLDVKGILQLAGFKIKQNQAEKITLILQE
jgi:proteasome lid subunit RPN8/RPN11